MSDTRYASFPWSLLEDKATRRFGKPKAQQFEGAGLTWTYAELASLIGFDVSSLQKWHQRGKVPMMHADRIALAFDDHPITFVDGWEEWAAAELTVEKAEQRKHERAKKQRRALVLAGKGEA